MKERRCLLFLVLMVCAALLLTSCALEQPETWALEAETASALKEEFSGEFAYLEEAWGQPIDQIDQASFSQFADAVNRAILDPELTEEGYRFGKLMDAIALASSGSADAAVYRSYGPVTGEFLGSAAVGTTIVEIPEKSFTVEEDCLPGITLTGDRSWSIWASLDGPEKGALLDNGMRATHCYGCGILFATVLRETTDSGEIYYLANPNASSFASCAAVTARGTLFVDAGAPAYGGSSYWTGRNHFEQTLRSAPELYLKGL